MGTKEIAKRIKNARLDAGLTQASVAGQLNITYQAISNYERGVSKIDNETLTKLCDIYGISISDILSDLYTCPVCGMAYSQETPSDRQQHDSYHQKWVTAASHFGNMLPSVKWGPIKNQSYDLLHAENSSFEQKCNAAIDLFITYFSRSIVRNDFNFAHPSFNEYAAMLLNQPRWEEELSRPVYESLCKKFGKAEGLPGNATTLSITESSPNKNHHDAAPQITAKEFSHIEKYRALDEHGKKMVDFVLREESIRMATANIDSIPLYLTNDARRKRYERLVENAQEQLQAFAQMLADIKRSDDNTDDGTIYLRRPYNKVAAAEGMGAWIDSDGYDEVGVVLNDLTRRADMILTVQGRSMEPTYRDGDQILIREQPSVMDGEIGIFIIDGEGYIKQKAADRLVSLNPEVLDVTVGDLQDCRCVGKVLGVLEPDWVVN